MQPQKFLASSENLWPAYGPSQGIRPLHFHPSRLIISDSEGILKDFCALAEASGLSNSQIAKLLNVRRDTIRHIKSGRREASPQLCTEFRAIVDNLEAGECH